MVAVAVVVVIADVAGRGPFLPPLPEQLADGAGHGRDRLMAELVGVDRLQRLRRDARGDGQEQDERESSSEHGRPRQVAVAMSYDDVIRIADLKTRRTRYDRVLRENSQALSAEDVVSAVTSMLHADPLAFQSRNRTLVHPSYCRPDYAAGLSAGGWPGCQVILWLVKGPLHLCHQS